MVGFWRRTLGRNAARWRRRSQLSADPLGGRESFVLELRALTSRELPAAALVLAKAHAAETDFRDAFRTGTLGLLQRLRSLFSYACHTHFSGGAPPIGVFSEGALVAAANILPPEGLSRARVSGWALLSARRLLMNALVGPWAGHAIKTYTSAVQAHEPSAPHHAVTQLGVLPEAQGSGYASALLSCACQLARDHSESEGVFLSTYSDSKAAFYRQQGFATCHRVTVRHVPCWSLFKPTRPASSAA